MAVSTRISPCLWLDGQAEEAARFYTSVFKHSRICEISRFSKVGTEIHGREPGSVMMVVLELDGMRLNLLNGGPLFKLSEAISLIVECRDQAEIDYYWSRLGEGGDPAAQNCGWLKDRFGLSWQIVPAGLGEVLADHTSPQAERAMGALLDMKKIDIAQLERARES